MKPDLSKLIAMPIFAILLAVRKPAFWIAIVCAGGIWWFTKQKEVVQSEQNQVIFAQVLATDEFVPTSNGPVPLSQIHTNTELELLEFTFSEAFSEALLASFRMKNGRAPDDWDELRTSGVASNLPPAPKGFRILFNESIGLFEMVRNP